MGCFSFLAGPKAAAPSKRPAAPPKRPAARSSCSACCCGCCGCLPCGRCRRGVTSDAGARKEARAGLEDIIRGYRRIARLDLPPGAAHLLMNIRENIVELEVVTREAKMMKARPWLTPFSDEQRDWERLHPEGGLLLRRQMCLAALDDDEWSMGYLFISDTGVAFDSGDIPGELVPLQTGLVQWQDIASLEKPPGPKTSLSVCLKSSEARSFTVLKLQLSISSDVEWLEEFSHLRAGMGRMRRVASYTVPDNEEHIQAPFQSQVPRFLGARASDYQEPLLGQEAEPREHVISVDEPNAAPQRGPGALSKPSILQQRSNTARKLSESSPQTPAATEETAKKTLKWSGSEAFADSPQTSTAEKPPNDKPVGSEIIAANMSKVGAAVESDDFIPRFVRESPGISDVSATPWCPSRRMPGTVVRKVTFTLVLPKDIPRAISRLISLPETSTVTVVYRLRRTEERVIMTYQTCTHDVTFGENFRVQETVFLQPKGNNVELTKYAEVIWVAALPWTHGAIKSFIEKKAIADTTASIGLFVQILKDVVSS